MVNPHNEINVGYIDCFSRKLTWAMFYFVLLLSYKQYLMCWLEVFMKTQGNMKVNLYRMGHSLPTNYQHMNPTQLSHADERVMQFYHCARFAKNLVTQDKFQRRRSFAQDSYDHKYDTKLTNSKFDLFPLYSKPHNWMLIQVEGTSNKTLAFFLSIQIRSHPYIFYIHKHTNYDQ